MVDKTWLYYLEFQAAANEIRIGRIGIHFEG